MEKMEEKVGGGSEHLRTAEKEGPGETKEIKKKASKVLESRGAEAAEGQEGVELSEGKISETVGEDKAHAPQGQGAKTYTADEIEVIRAKLLAALPPQEVMIKQIKRKLYRQEDVLTKKMKKYRRKAHRHAFELTIVVGKLREIHAYFTMLAHATYELIKHLWLKIVHGV